MKIENVKVDAKIKLKWDFAGSEFHSWLEFDPQIDDYKLFINEEARYEVDCEYVRSVTCAIYNIGSDRPIYFA